MQPSKGLRAKSIECSCFRENSPESWRRPHRVAQDLSWRSAPSRAAEVRLCGWLTRSSARPMFFSRSDKQRRIVGIEALAKDIARGFKRSSFRDFEMVCDLRRESVRSLVIGWLGYGLRRLSSSDARAKFFKVILCGTVVAVRPVLVRLFWPLRTPCRSWLFARRTCSARSTRAESPVSCETARPNSELRSDFDQRKKPRHDGADSQRDRIDAEDQKIGGVSINFLAATGLGCGGSLAVRAVLVDERQLDPCVSGHPRPIGAVLLHIRHRRER